MSAPPLSAEYVIVGSGAGGGPLAVRLATAGHSVLVLEAGELAAGLVYDVPVFHGFATESPDMAWNFFVSHYDDETQAKRDEKYDAGRGGVLYPRSATIGGCTAHNAMITVYPNDADWDDIADLTGDRSWDAATMRTYFESLERCTYWPKWIATVVSRLARFFPALDVRGHGFGGWLPTSIAKPSLLAKDWQLIRAVASDAEKELGAWQEKPLKPWQRLSRWWFDPNIAAVQNKDSLLGLWLVPIAVGAARRHGTREPLLETAAAPGSKLRILSGCCATRLVLDAQNRCTGVEFVTGAHLYRADPNATGAPPRPVQVAVATREVIVAGGTFNTPQLLKLSGIGPADELREFGIEVRVNLPGVGANLQDRYEVTVVTEMPRQLGLLTGGTFRPPQPGDTEPDPLLAAWRDGKGPYTTNGALLAIIASSSPVAPLPDLFLFALPADFRGYRVGYCDDLERNKDRLTWAILKAHTNNRAGSVALRSADPLDPPDIRFHYFEEGSDAAGSDLDAVVAGVKLARGFTGRLSAWGAREIWPGPDVDTDEDIRQYVRDNAWGHHACGTCAIGPNGDPNAVLDSEFRVRGVSGLRVVDASVFPQIPGYFIVTAVYMISEKAADVILAHAARVPAQTS